MNQQSTGIFKNICQDFLAKIWSLEQHLNIKVFINGDRKKQLQFILTNKYVVLGEKTFPQHSIFHFYTENDANLKFQVIYNNTSSFHINQGIPTNKIGFRLIKQKLKPVQFEIIDQNMREAYIARLNKHLTQYLSKQIFQTIYKKYQILATGTYACVYDAYRIKDSNHSQHFALRIISKEATIESPEIINQLCLINQVQIMRDLNNPNVIKLIQTYETQNRFCMILQLLKGRDLQQHIRDRIKQNKKFTPEQIRKIMIGIAKGLKYLHQKRIMHRDLKPKNIGIRSKQSMQPVIIDFGFAINVDSNDYIFQACGTPGYVAPQILKLKKGQKVEPTCDVFSAGAIFHYLLTLKPLFEGSQNKQILSNNKQHKFNLLSSAYNNIDVRAMDLLKSMLRIEPKDRISAANMLKHPYLRAGQQKENQQKPGSASTVVEKQQFKKD